MGISDPKKFVSVTFTSTLLAAFSLGSILVYSNPDNKSLLVILFLYLSVFLFSLGFFTLFGLGIRRYYAKDLFAVSLSHSLRQAILLSVFLIICLFLSSQNLLLWWVGLSLLLPFALIEIFVNLKI
jgi:hypothetical protein